jgi:hypothetical protein
MPRRIFLLSPANCAGERARMVLRDQAQFELAMQLRTPKGAPIGDVFAFLSGLYFRGKLAYARAFGDPPARTDLSGAYVITTNRGLLPADMHVTGEELRAMATGAIDAEDENYRRPLIESATRIHSALARHRDAEAEVVLLGSVATGKYVDILLDAFGSRLHFPIDFVGRGDMSRGGLMLRCVDTGQQLAYVPITGAVRRGARPPKLERRVLPTRSQ